MVQQTRLHQFQGFSLILILSFALAGCAGPYTPFGANSSWSMRWARIKAWTKDTFNGASRPRIQFSPSRQLYHDQYDLVVLIEDKEAIAAQPQLQVIYNNLDVTESFLKQAVVSFDDPLTLRMMVPNIRFPLNRRHQITFIYNRASEPQSLVAHYSPPECPLIKQSGDMRLPASTNKMNSELTSEVFDLAEKTQINPYLILAMINQESQFNSEAVSDKRAIGLMQITATAEEEILREQSAQALEWPQYPKINSMSPWMIKALIATGRINATNEWRLNPKQAIDGGVRYLQYLQNYWNAPNNLSLVTQNTKGELRSHATKVVLASYNAGPVRVRKWLESKGSDWLLDPDLNLVRRYVLNIESICQELSEPNERSWDDQASGYF